MPSKAELSVLCTVALAVSTLVGPLQYLYDCILYFCILYFCICTVAPGVCGQGASVQFTGCRQSSHS